MKKRRTKLSKAIVWEKFPWQNLPGSPIIGVDEVGRGCLAGPVYASAVIINPNKPWKHYTDSKKLSASRRQEYGAQIQADHRVGIGFASVKEITKLNILHASLLAMCRAIRELGVDGGHILVDGHQKIPGLEVFEQTTLIKGDLRAEPIAAASIVAKVTRDSLLVQAAQEFPNYGFEDHKGYATSAHKKALQMFGPCSLHRPTFAGVKEFL